MKVERLQLIPQKYKEFLENIMTYMPRNLKKDEMDKFLEKDNLPKLNEEQAENLKSDNS